MEYYHDSYNQHLTWNTKNITTMNTNKRRSSVQVPFGGFAWPPRSYTCSFCKREFRSAQALGGHMNVHRRDRARLNQSESVPIPVRVAKISNRRRCLVDEDDSSTAESSVVVNEYKRHKISEQRVYGNWCGSVEEIDLELRLGSDPTPVK